MSEFRNITSRLLTLTLAVLCLVFVSSAQTENARIQGTVADASEAAIPGATVLVREIDTGREVSTQTNESGSYTVVSLPPGRYQIEITQANFKTTRQEITLQIQQVAVLNFNLEAGGISEVVNIEAEAPLVDAATSAIGEVVTGRRITELPLNGRNVLELARLIPGVTQGVRNGFATGVGGNVSQRQHRRGVER